MPETRILRAARHFRINGDPRNDARLDGRVDIYALFHALNGAIARESDGTVRCSVRDNSFGEWREAGWDREARRPRAVLLLDYGDAGADVSRVYEDLERIKLREILAGALPGTLADIAEDCHAPGVVAMVEDFYDPFELRFEPNSEGAGGMARKQKNTLSVGGIGNPNKTLVRKLTELCGEKECTAEFILPKLVTLKGHRPPRYEWKDGNLYGGGVAPEFRLNATWEGGNFLHRALGLFGEARTLLYPTHIRESAKAMPYIIKAQCFEQLPKSVTLNSEGMAPVPASDLEASFGAEVPFKSGGREMLAHLDYFHFRGR